VPRLAAVGALVVGAATALGACSGGKPISIRPPTTTTLPPTVVELEPSRAVVAEVLERAAVVLRRRVELAGATGSVAVVPGGVEARVDAGAGQARAVAVLARTGRVLFRPVLMPRDVGDCPATSPDRELANRPATLVEQQGGHTVACFALGPSELDNAVVDTAQATQEPTDGSWQVELTFTAKGTHDFDAMAARYIGRQIAIDLDAVVLSAPTVQTADFNGRAIVRPFSDEDEARRVAVLLGSGALPVSLRPRSAP